MGKGHALDFGRRTYAVASKGPIAAWLRRTRRRREADDLLRVSEGRWERHPSVAWRVAELTSSCERRSVAGTLRTIVAEARDPRPRLTSVLACRHLRNHVSQLQLLSHRVEDLERPVSGAGMVLMRDLLRDGGGPLYLGGDEAELDFALDRVVEILEVR